MDIFIIRHNWDNGESFEDKEHYQEDKYYSTRTAAIASWGKIGPFEGMYTFLKVTLDTQETEIIEQTQYNRCTPAYILADREAKEEADRMAAEEEFDRWVAQQLAEME